MQMKYWLSLFPIPQQLATLSFNLSSQALIKKIPTHSDSWPPEGGGRALQIHIGKWKKILQSSLVHCSKGTSVASALDAAAEGILKSGFEGE